MIYYDLFSVFTLSSVNYLLSFYAKFIAVQTRKQILLSHIDQKQILKATYYTAKLLTLFLVINTTLQT